VIHWEGQNIMNNGSIYNPGSSSYTKRIIALQGVLKARQEVQKSKAYSHNPMWSNALGSPAEIEQAEQTIEASLVTAGKDFHKNEIKQAVEKGLISEKDVRDIMDAIHRHDMSAQRSEMSSDKKKQSDQQS
jgi:hypothetical protein